MSNEQHIGNGAYSAASHILSFLRPNFPLLAAARISVILSTVVAIFDLRGDLNDPLLLPEKGHAPKGEKRRKGFSFLSENE